ncbi:MAG TPA: selenide, water dikinase SelD [Leptolyngbyaceae cyanobacterium M65_K2018_010]|nr:selenide, water dikinase SelD [Leptolyngbyaceae cyanobacterium M65_K2018_010]
MQTAPPITTDVVLVGGGHTHALVLRRFGMLRLPGIQLTLITDVVDTPYSGMLPSHIAGRYGFDESHIDLRPLTRFAQCRLLRDRVIGLDLDQQRVLCAHHPPVAFDLLSIDTGSTPATATVPGAADYVIPAKPVSQLLQGWNQLLEEVDRFPPRPLTLAVVGGGVGGVELTLSMQERLCQRLHARGQPGEQAQFHLFHRGAELAPGRNSWTRRRLQHICRSRGIHLHLGEPVEAITQDRTTGSLLIHGGAGVPVRCDRIFWVTSAAAPPWLQGSGLSLDAQGFIQVGDTLQTLSHPQVFAAGDVATMVNHPRPKAGVFAVRQGPPLFENLLRRLQGRPLKPFRPQREFLNLIDVGYGKTIAAWGPLAFESPLCRRWKDHIDRKFMALFTDFPAMAVPASLPLPLFPDGGSPPPPCAGCGAKVGAHALSQALQRLRQDRPELSGPSPAVIIGLESPDDAAVMAVPPGQVMVHTVDFFPALVEDPFVFAQIALKHGLSDLYAMGATPHSVLAMVQLPYATPPKQVEILYHLLAGTLKGLRPTATPLVGGHTTLGPQLALGFACNGLAPADQLLRKGGLQVGDRLILTQALGTGTLFAADMQQRAKGRWIEAAIAAMVTSNQAAAAILRSHQATACTDVTGFGLVGHGLEMARAAPVNVELDLAALPILPGARETLAQGWVSTLYPQNLEAAAAIANGSAYTHHPDFPLLFDPQTAGGLLATVPADQATACVAQLRDQGYPQATLLGEVTLPTNPQAPIRIRSW